MNNSARFLVSGKVVLMVQRALAVQLQRASSAGERESLRDVLHEFDSGLHKPVQIQQRTSLGGECCGHEHCGHLDIEHNDPEVLPYCRVNGCDCPGFEE